jgi:predicted enzyme related to lactoylglutathione lyase
MSRVIHFEMSADDPERAIRFYSEALGWTIEKWTGPFDYWLVMTGPTDQPGIDGGLSRRGDTLASTVNTIGVDSVDETVAKVVAAGGKVIRPKMPVPGVGFMAYCEDTEGNTFGIMQMDESAR